MMFIAVDMFGFNQFSVLIKVVSSRFSFCEHTESIKNAREIM